MLKLKGLDHFGIEVSDMERSLDFYAQTLGMELHARFGHMSVMKCGDNDLALFERQTFPPPPESSPNPEAVVTGPSASARQTSPRPRPASPPRASPSTAPSTGVTISASISLTPTTTSSSLSHTLNKATIAA